jgi:hypothetical protein
MFYLTKGIRSADMRAMVPMHTVKVLSVFPFGLCLDDVLNFIRCFLCLEKLYIQLVMFLSSIYGSHIQC